MTNHLLVKFRAGLFLGLVVTVAAIAAGCSREPRWSAGDKDNARHYFLSLAASERASALISRPHPDVPQFDLSEINKYYRIALTEAQLVHDRVLEKAHPGLKKHFRGEYQQGLERILSSYQSAHSSARNPPASAQIDMQAAGVALLKDWTSWLHAHAREIKMPPQSALKGEKSGLAART